MSTKLPINKIVWVAILFAVAAIGVASGAWYASNKKTFQSAPSRPITKEYLISTSWGAEDSSLFPFVNLSFYPDDTFARESSGGEGDFGKPCKGVFRIEGNAVRLTFTGPVNENDPGEPPCVPHEETLNFRTTNESLFRTEFLFGDHLKYWAGNSEVPEGVTRYLKIRRRKIPLIITHPNLVPRENAIVRFAPDRNGGKVTFSDPACETCTSAQLVSDGFAGVVGRTVYKDTINGKRDYWYYVSITQSWYGSYTVEKGYAGNRLRPSYYDPEPDTWPANDYFVKPFWIHGSDLAPADS